MTNSARAQYTDPLTDASMIALQVVVTSFGFHLRECMGSCFPPPPPPRHYINRPFVKAFHNTLNIDGLNHVSLEDEPIFISIKQFQLVFSVLTVMTRQFPIFLFRLLFE